MTGPAVVTRQQWCTCGAALKTTDSDPVVRYLTAEWWTFHTGTGHQTTDRITAARERRRQRLAGAA